MCAIVRGIPFAGLLAAPLISGVDAGKAQDQPAGAIELALASLDTTVLPVAEREAAARMVEDDVERRLREANERSSAEWRVIATREQWEKFRTAKLAALRDSLGPPAVAVPLGLRVTGTVSGDGYRIENVVYQSRPGLWVTANLYRPDKPQPSMPGILISHAHHTPKEHGELQDMGVTWARAGCFVLAPDHIGHGERRQHPFKAKEDYERSFQVSRQDYFFRYDAAIRLHLAGESLIGWIAHDLMRGVDVLLTQENIDPKRIILLGAVAGGGDPAAVTAALDERITVAVPFNFGGPQPETRYPLPGDAETSFNYAGGGSWESTRNLRRSASDGFLPWVIVGSIAPRRLVYGHEFRWDRERDPVWNRLQTIFGFYQSGTMLGAQLRDLRAVLAWLRARDDVDARNLGLWGDSLALPNPPGTDFQIPREDDGALLMSPEPLGGLLALFAALYEIDVRAVYLHGGLASFAFVLKQQLVLLPHDAVVPGALTAGDLCDVVAALTPCRVRLEGTVDGWNRSLSEPDIAGEYEPAAAAFRAAGCAAEFSFGTGRTGCVQWLAGGKAGGP